MSDTTENPQKLLELAALARDRSSYARTSLFEKVAGIVFDAAARPPEQVLALADDILMGLVRNVEKAVRKNLAQRMAMLDYAPTKLLNHLAQDDIEVATPILQDCPALLEDDMRAILATVERPHRVALAGRTRLPPSVSDDLVRYDEPEVLLRLASNRGAELSRQTFESLTERSKALEPLRRALLSRPDMPGDLAHRMFWWVGASLRRYILDRFAVDPAVVSDLIGEAVAEVAVDHEEQQSRRRILPWGRQNNAARAPTVADLVQMLRASDSGAFIESLARMVGIDRAMSERVYKDEGGEALAVACRAVDADRSQFTTIMLLADYRLYGRTRPIGHLEHISAIYDCVSPENARATVRFWNAVERKAA